ncbi:DUF3572 domain-containing protein [Lentilitoribacter sp. EG35]|uniref:DUF3572 domain-containing protein n=1 Tax=Lentilitoribacter sp. EG35 TaxID=3234192 RepID=UPI00345F3012
MEKAESIAIDVLSWIATDPELFNRFVDLSGLDPSQIREAAQEQGFLAGVLGFIMNHEPTLLNYCSAQNERPEDVARAFQSLGGQVNNGW